MRWSLVGALIAAGMALLWMVFSPPPPPPLVPAFTQRVDVRGRRASAAAAQRASASASDAVWGVAVSPERLAAQFPYAGGVRAVRSVFGAWRADGASGAGEVARACRRVDAGSGVARRCTAAEQREHQRTHRMVQTTLEERGFVQASAAQARAPALLWLAIPLPLVRSADAPRSVFGALASPHHWVNRLPGAAELLNRKDAIARAIAAYRAQYPRLDPPLEHPRSFELPDAWDELRAAAAADPGALWLLKPCYGGQGAGISVVREIPDAPPAAGGEPMLAQRYLDRPFLVDGKKQTVRLYALVTSVLPLRLYLHATGIVKMATIDWSREHLDLTRHVTNQAANKNAAGYVLPPPGAEDVGSRWSLRAFRRYLREKRGVDDVALWRRIELGMLDYVLAALPGLVAEAAEWADRPEALRGAFQLLGVDVDLQEADDGSVYPVFIEANVNPTLKGNPKLPFETDAKYAMLHEMWAMLGVGRHDSELARAHAASRVSLWLERHNWAVGEPPRVRHVQPADADLLATQDMEMAAAGGFARLFPEADAWATRQAAVEDAYRALPVATRREQLRRLRLSVTWAERTPERRARAAQADIE